MPYGLLLKGSIRVRFLTGPKPKETKVETFRIDYLIRTPKAEKLSLRPIRIYKGSILELRNGAVGFRV